MEAEHPLLVKLAQGLDLSEEEAAAVRAVPFQLDQFKADEVISREGDSPSRSFLVAEGLTCISKIVADGRRQIMTLQIPGDAPDFHTIHLQHLDSDLWAITDCTLAYMAHEDLRRLGREHPRLMEEMWRFTLVEASIYREWMVNNSQRQAESRMAHLFCEMMVRMETVGLPQDKTCSLPITQADLGEMTGLSPVHVNRTLQILRGQNLITFERGTLTIHDWDALAELGDFRPGYLHLRAGGRKAG